MAVFRYSKGQVQDLETIMITVIIVILIILGVYFYFKVVASNIEETGIEVSEIKGSVLLDRVTSLPEFTCGINCVDVSKLLASKYVINNNKVYYKSLFGDNFGIKRIEFEQVYPVVKSNKVCEKADFSSGDCKIYVVYDSLAKVGFNISSVVSIYNPKSNKYSIGKVIVGVSR